MQEPTKEQIKFKTPYTKTALLILLSQPIGLIALTSILYLPFFSIVRTTYVLGNITIIQFVPFVVLVLMIFNFLFSFNKYPVWVAMDETGINYRAYSKPKTMTPWADITDAGILIDPNKPNKKYIYFSIEQVTEETKKRLLHINQQFRKKPTAFVVLCSEENLRQIEQYYKGKIKEFDSEELETEEE